MKKVNTERVVLIMWFLFGCFLIFQHRAVFMHFDDFGYASLSYGYTNNNNGMNWNLSDLIKFLKWHYFDWGGRVLFYGIYILLLKAGESIIQLFQAFVLFGISFLTYKLIKTKEHDILASILVFVMYTAIGHGAVTDGLFWYAASVGYVWPFLPFLCALFLINTGLKTKIQKIGAAICIFIAGFSHEQVAVFVILFLVLWEMYLSYMEGHIKKDTLYIVVSGIVGACIEIFAPGNFVRTDNNADFYNMSLWGKILKNVPEILNANLGKNQLAWVVVWIVALICVGYLLYKDSRKCLVIMLDNMVLSTCIIFSMGMNNNNPFVVATRCLFVIATILELVVYFWKAKNEIYFCIVIAAAGTQAMMVMAPSVGDRTTLPFQIPMHIIFASIMLDMIRKYKNHVLRFCIAGVSVLAICNVGLITSGYYQNKQVNEINRRRLEEKSYLLKAGNQVSAIILYRLPNDKYATSMPYHYEWIGSWVKNYYELPQSVPFIWNDLDCIANKYEVVVSKIPVINSIWPERLDENFARTEDNGINFSVTPDVMDKNLVIYANGTELQTTIEESFMTAHLTEDYLNADVEIKIVDKASGEESEPVYVKVNKTN